jgi:hypothetical protein
MMGPVQVLVVGFDRPAFSGEILAEFTRLRQAGVVRLIDVLLVSRAADGAVETLPTPAGADAGLGVLVAALLGRADGEADGEAGAAGVSAWSLADAVPPDSVAAVALIEHVWAGPLAAAIQQAGGAPLEETWLAPDDRAALEALMDRHAADGPS